MTKIEMMNSSGASQQENMMNQIVLDDHLLNQISMTVEPLTESMMILSESVSIALNQTQQTFTRVNNNSFKLSEKYNRPTSPKVRRTTQKAAQILNRLKKQYNKDSIKTYNKSGLNSWSPNLATVLLVGYLIMQKQPTQPQINLDSRAVAVSIVEQLRSRS